MPPTPVPTKRARSLRLGRELSGLRHGFCRCCHCELSESVGASGFLGVVEVLRRFEIIDTAFARWGFAT